MATWPCPLPHGKTPCMCKYPMQSYATGFYNPWRVRSAAGSACRCFLLSFFAAWPWRPCWAITCSSRNRLEPIQLNYCGSGYLTVIIGNYWAAVPDVLWSLWSHLRCSNNWNEPSARWPWRYGYTWPAPKHRVTQHMLNRWTCKWVVETLAEKHDKSNNSHQQS